MTAPGENLEFNQGIHFKAKAASQTGLMPAVTDFIKDRPDRARHLVGPVWSIVVLFNGQEWTVLFSRIGQRIGLMNAFGPGQGTQLAGRERELKKAFGKGAER